MNPTRPSPRPTRRPGRGPARASLAAGVLAALLSAGCAITRPPAQVAAATPAQWYAPLPHGGSVSQLSAWWQQLNDPVLVELIVAAQEASPTVAQAANRIEQARAARALARSVLAPTLDASAAVSRAKSAPPGGIANAAQLGLQTAWEIDLFGAGRAGVDAAGARLAGAQAGWHEARVAVAAEVGASYVQLRTCERQLAVAENDARSRAETARLTQLSADAGFTAPASAARARARAAEGAARVKQQRAECEIELKTLVALSALAEPALRQKLATAWTEPAETGLFSVPALPAQLLAQRPDVYQAELEVAAASAEVGAARADRYPRLTLSGALTGGRVRAAGVSSDLETWSIGPLALSLPLLDGGRRAANVDAAVGAYDEAVALYRARVRQAVREVEQALVTLASANSRHEDARQAAEGYRISFNATEARYRGGLASLVELEDQRRVLLAAQTALVSLQRERAQAWIALYRAAGGGWQRGDEATAAAPAAGVARP